MVDATLFGPYQLQELFGRGSMGRWTIPRADAGYQEHPPRVGFFTDTSVCIGCKACEVASKEWHGVPDDGSNLLGMSFDNTGMLGAKRGGTSR